MAEVAFGEGHPFTLVDASVFEPPHDWHLVTPHRWSQIASRAEIFPPAAGAPMIWTRW